MKPIFIDYIEISVKAGDGGNGCSSFYRDRRMRFPKPNGGDGGKGGDIILVARRDMHTLLDLQYQKHFVAQNGGHGEGNHKKGRDGQNCLIRVPQGSLIKDYRTGRILRDLTEEGSSVIVARGGKGGKGNRTRQEATKGERGEEKRLVLELKLMADVGLIGYPNVGKSTLLNRISAAKSKVADYPFTTKVPILGHVEIEDKEIIFTVADMPGLIEGAHQGRGLGHEFLRHIERTKVLVHIIDISQSEGRDAYQDYLSLNKELSLYNPKLREKPQIVVANKMDLVQSSENLRRFSEKFKERIYPISALKGEGIEDLLKAISTVLV